MSAASGRDDDLDREEETLPGVPLPDSEGPRADDPQADDDGLGRDDRTIVGGYEDLPTQAPTDPDQPIDPDDTADIDPRELDTGDFGTPSREMETGDLTEAASGLRDDEETLAPTELDTGDLTEVSRELQGEQATMAGFEAPHHPDDVHETEMDTGDLTEASRELQDENATIAGFGVAHDDDDDDDDRSPTEMDTGDLTEAAQGLDDDATIAGFGPPGGEPQRPARKAPLEDDDATIVGGMADLGRGKAVEDDTLGAEGETIIGGAGATQGPSPPSRTKSHGAAGTRRLGRRKKVKQITKKKGVTATRRDPAAGGPSGPTPGVGPPGQMKLEKGELLAGRYELVRRLGVGGMGEVWQARHTLLDGMRAIKVIKASISRDPTFRERFLSEGQTMMRVKHPGVVEVTDLDETRENRELFMVMQYLKGRTLYDAVRDADDPLQGDLRNTVRIYMENAIGIQRIHDERIVHKDLKTDNTLLVVGDDGLEHPKVIDFGLAKRLEDPDVPPEEGAKDDPERGKHEKGTRAGMDMQTTLSGTLAYMAPEQFAAKASTFQSDIYAWGVMFYEAFFNGEYPMPRGGLMHYMNMHGDDARRADYLAETRPDLPEFLAKLIDQCMETHKEDRPESFTWIAEQLQWWLDIPVRRAKRNKMLAMVGGFLLMVSIAVAGFMMSETLAALGVLEVAAGDVEFQTQADDQKVYLPDSALKELRFSAEITGEPKDPVFEVDGKVRQVEAAVEMIAHTNGEEVAHLITTVDLSDLPDGEHEIVFAAADGGAPTNMTIVVDRKAPTIEQVSVDVGNGAGNFSDEESPDVRVVLDEDTIDRVLAQVEGGKRRVGATESGAKREKSYLVSATADGDGTWRMTIEVADFAGNTTRAPFEYVCDTGDPTARIADVKNVNGESVLQVRDGVNAKLSTTVSEAGVATLKAGDAASIEKTVDAAGPVVFDLPPVPGTDLATTFTFTDRAGNATTSKLRVHQQSDTTSLKTTDGDTKLNVTGEDEIQLVVHRTYDIAAADLGLSALRLRDAAGVEVNEAPVLLEPTFGAADRFQVAATIGGDDLPEGTWRVSPVGQGEARIQPLTLTIDRARPKVIGGFKVREENGREVAPGTWSKSQVVVVDVEVEDLSLQSIALGDAELVSENARPGRHVYTFRWDLEVQDTNSAALSLTDATGNQTNRPLKVNGDWDAPILNLIEPVPTKTYNDQNSTPFAGTCSEEKYDLIITTDGLANGEASARFAQTSPTVAAAALFAVGENWRVSVIARDRAGNESAPLVLTIDVEQLEIKLPKEFLWEENGISAWMDKVDPGDVVIGGRVVPVKSEVYIDRHEVTNAEYRRFLAAAKAWRPEKAGERAPWAHKEQPKGWDYTPPAKTWADPKWSADELPVVNVTYWDAHAYAAWSGRRLPKEAEWVKAAAKDPELPDLRRFTTGNTWESGKIVTNEMTAKASFQGPHPAKSGKDESPLGCLHMGGNVSEWVDLQRVPDGARTTGVRGGNWYLSPRASELRDTPALPYARSQRSDTIGFRTVCEGESVLPRVKQ